MVDYTKRENRAAAAAAPRSQAVAYDQGLRSYMLRVYNQMGLGLALTGLVAMVAAQSPAVMQLVAGGGMWVLLIAQVGMVMYLSARVFSMSEGAGKAWFFAYSALNGLTFAILFLAYTQGSIARVFFITAAMFGAMSLYGYTTKKDLTGFGQFLIMGLFGLIIASLVNLFLKSPGLYYATSYIGVLLFVGLTAYDTQKVKNMYYQVGADNIGKAATLGALNLYLDFINLMIMLLRIMGDRR